MMLISRSHELFHRKKRPVFALLLALLVCLLPLFLLAGCGGSAVATPTWPSTSYSLATPAPKGTGPQQLCEFQKITRRLATQSKQRSPAI